MLKPNKATFSVFPCGAQIPVKMSGHKPDRLLSTLGVGRCLQSSCCLHDTVHVDSRFVVQESPAEPWYVETQGLTYQNHRYPLIVAYTTLGFVLVWNSLLSHGNIVSVGHPAHFIGEILMVVCELGRTPASDRLADILLGADD